MNPHRVIYLNRGAPPPPIVIRPSPVCLPAIRERRRLSRGELLCLGLERPREPCEVVLVQQWHEWADLAKRRYSGSRNPYEAMREALVDFLERIGNQGA